MERFLANFPIQSVDTSNKEYPEALKQIPDLPEILYYRGELPNSQENYFAIVGTRRASDYGKEIAFSFAKQLSEAGLIIVSGMALGIDTFSHKGALEVVKGSPLPLCPTVAVLGTGLDEQSVYPQENLKLAKQILEKGGCLISEYPEGIRGTSFTFPQRNRIIAGLSLGVLVVEAKIKSGALITASLAKKYNRKIFAVPGSVYSQNSKGCHLLIKQDAKLVESAKDILRELGIYHLLTKQQTAASSEEQLIIEALQNGASHIDKIIEKTGLPSQTISGIISIMEMKEKIKNLGGNTYALLR